MESRLGGREEGSRDETARGESGVSRTVYLVDLVEDKIENVTVDVGDWHGADGGTCAVGP